MPQLNPAPWLLMFILTWLMLILLFSKILKTYYFSSVLLTNQKPQNINWNWPWY